jgi:hypothetical protein
MRRRCYGSARISIYATLWELKWPRDGSWAMSDDDYVEVWCQAVPAHIGHPSDYPEGDPFADFLPPPVLLDETNELQGPPYRAVFICGLMTYKGTTRSGPE